MDTPCHPPLLRTRVQAIASVRYLLGVNWGDSGCSLGSICLCLSLPLPSPRDLDPFNLDVTEIGSEIRCSARTQRHQARSAVVVRGSMAPLVLVNYL
jgi:hypothetical protein